MSTKKHSLKEILSSDKPEEVIQELRFEQGLSLLEQLVEQVEGGELDLDKALLSYERGTLIVKKLEEHLAGAEKKLEVLGKK